MFCTCDRPGLGARHELICSNILVVFLPVRNYGDKTLDIKGMENDCCRMYNYCLHELGLDIMYKELIDGKTTTKIDSKRYGTYAKHVSKITFKYNWEYGEIGSYIVQVRKWLTLSPRLYDGLLFWRASRGAPIEEELGSTNAILYDTNGGEMEDNFY